MRTSIHPLSQLLLAALVVALAGEGVAQNQRPAPQPIRRASSNPSQPWSTIDTQPTYGGGGGGWGGGWGGWGGGGGTVAGNAYNGMANVVRAQGDFNLSTSQAYVNMEEARRRNIENRKEWTDAFFEMRRANSDYRAAERGPRGTPEDWVRLAREAAPNRLSPGELDFVNGSIAWPKLLQGDEYKKNRLRLEQLFEQRAHKGGSIGPDGFLRIRELTSALQDQLKSNIKRYPPNEYVSSRRFLESLAHEARFASN